MSSDPPPLNAVAPGRVIERPPQVAVLDRLLVSGRPPAFFQLWIHSVMPVRTYSLSVNS